MSLSPEELRALINDTVRAALADATEDLEKKITELHGKVIGDGENGLSARTKRNEDKIAAMESTFGKIYTIATIPLGGLIMMAVNYVFGSNHPTK